MITYTEKNIETKDLICFRFIEQIINLLEVPDLGFDKNGKKNELTCHMLAQAIVVFFGQELELKHGYFMTCYEHSWLVTKEHKNIIDVYPWGTVGGPLLIVRNVSSSGKFYIEKELNIQSSLHKSSIALVKKAIINSIKEILNKQTSFANKPIIH